jgi:DNA-binding response OmpR family regulator
MKVLIIEDEIPAQRMLKNMLAALDYEIEVVDCLNSVKSSVEWFKHNPMASVLILLSK